MAGRMAVPARKPKPVHPEDYELAAQIAKATRFSACLHLGPGNRTTRYVEKGGAEGYAEALVIAAELNTTSRFGRRSIVYAINTLGSFSVTPELAKLAGLI
jgi:hypothetical protein